MKQSAHSLRQHRESLVRGRAAKNGSLADGTTVLSSKSSARLLL